MGRRFRDDLAKRLEDSRFAEEFGAEAAKTDLALTLAEARLRSGVTQVQLANRLGKTQSYIAKLERGDANPTVGNVGRIMATMGLKLSTEAIPLMADVVPVSRARQMSSSETTMDFFRKRTAADVVRAVGSDAREAFSFEVESR
jgi:transcriptional regulator with XRE-family HTH domain